MRQLIILRLCSVIWVMSGAYNSIIIILAVWVFKWIEIHMKWINNWVSTEDENRKISHLIWCYIVYLMNNGTIKWAIRQWFEKFIADPIHKSYLIRLVFGIETKTFESIDHYTAWLEKSSITKLDEFNLSNRSVNRVKNTWRKLLLKHC